MSSSFSIEEACICLRIPSDIWPQVLACTCMYTAKLPVGQKLPTYIIHRLLWRHHVRTALWLCASPQCLFAIYVCCIQCTDFYDLYRLIGESPRWLLIQGKPEKARKEVRKAAKMNKCDYPDDLMDQEMTLLPDKVNTPTTAPSPSFDGLL